MKQYLLHIFTTLVLIGTSFIGRAEESEPFLAYAKGSVNSSLTIVNADLLKNNTLAEGHAWFISPVDNYAPIAIVNSGDSDIEITRVEFSEGFGFSSKVEISIPATVVHDQALFLNPSLTATEPGFYSGEMKVFVEGLEEPLIVKLEGAIKPEYETKTIFHNEEGLRVHEKMRSGWLAIGGWEIGETNEDYQQVYPGKWWWFQAAIMQGNTEENAILCSPLISFEKGAEVWFDATCYQPEDAIDVLYSKDRTNWTLLKTLTVPPVHPDETNPLTEDMFNGFFSSMGQGYENLFKTFKVTVPEEGNGCIAFRTSSNRASVDNVVMDGSPVDFDVAYISHSIESEFPLNTVKDFSVTFRNLKDISVDEYQLQIVRDGQVFKTVDGTKPLPKGSDVPITLECAFSSLGDHTLSVNLIYGENIVRSEIANIKVVDEGYHETFQVGASHDAFNYADNYNSNFLDPAKEYVVKSEALYPPSTLQYINSLGASAANQGVDYNEGEELTGLRKGDKITSLQWTGYNSSSSGTLNTCELPVRLYLQNTPDSLYTDNKFTDINDLTLVGTKATYDLTKTGNDIRRSSTSIDFKEGIVKIVFDKPFEYTGESLRVVLELPKVYFKPEDAVENAVLFEGGTIWSVTSLGNVDYPISGNFLSIYQENSTETKLSFYIPILLMTKETQAKFLSGTVTHSLTGEGIEGVTVTASCEEGVAFSGVTNAEGKYEIEVGNPAFDFTVTASHGSFHPYTSANNEDVTTVNLAKDDVEHSFSMVEKIVAISGSVVDDKGNPVAEATVTLTNPEDETYSVEVETGDQGTFTLTTNQLNSNLTITVTKAGYAAVTQNVVVGDVEDGNTGEAITLQNDIVIYKNVTISGVVIDANQVVVEGATVTLSNENGIKEEVTTTADGEFSFTLNSLSQFPSIYTLTVEKDGYISYTNDKIEVEYSDVEVSDVVIYKYVTISGVVTDAKQTAVEGAAVTLFNENGTEEEVTTTADGEFSFTLNSLDQFPSIYTLTVEKDGYISYTNDKIEVEYSDVEVPDVVIYKLATIAGVVKDEDDNGIKGAKVTLSDADNNSSDYTTEESGAFSFPANDLDKEYTLTVTAEGYNDKTQTVKVEKDDVTGLTVTMVKKTVGIGSITSESLSVIPGYGKIEISAPGVEILVVDLAGNVVTHYKRLDGTVIVDGLSSGIYIVNNVKVVVR